MLVFLYVMESYNDGPIKISRQEVKKIQPHYYTTERQNSTRY